MAAPIEVKPAFIVIDAAVGVKRDQARKFGRHEKKFVLLPYHEELSCELDARFEHIKHGLVTAVLVNEQRPALRNYIFALKTFVNTYGFRFSKEDHLSLIKLLYLILVRKNQWEDLIECTAKALEDLMYRSYFGYEQLPLDWEPVYDLYYGASYGKRIEELDGKTLRNAVYRLKRFYKPSDSPKIWERIQVHLSPVYSSKEFCDLALLFLPVKMSTSEHKIYGASLWFDTMWKMYEVVEMGYKWGIELPNLFATLAYNNPDFMDWEPIYDTIFTRTIRAMGLSIREGKAPVGEGQGAAALSGLARVVVATFGGPRGCQKHLERMMKLVEPLMHPSNESGHTVLVLVFLQNLLQETVNRYREERIKKHKREVPTKFYLTDEDIAKFTEVLLPSLLYALYTKDGSISKAPCKLVMILCALCPGRVFPKVFEHIYSAFFAVEEPYRLSQALECLYELVFLISTDTDPKMKRMPMDKDWIKQVERVRSPDSPIAPYSLNKLSHSLGFKIIDQLKTYRCHLFYLLEMLIEGIDINDVAKAYIAIQSTRATQRFFHYQTYSLLIAGDEYGSPTLIFTAVPDGSRNADVYIEKLKASSMTTNIMLIFYMVPILDYSECIKHHKLTKEEQALCKLSVRLPILAEMTLDKILDIIQCLSVTAPKDSSNVIGSFKDQATKEGSEEKILKQAINSCVSAIFKNADDPVTKKLGKKMLRFVETNQFESSLATEMISSMMQSVTYELPSIWRYFAVHVVRNLRIVLTPEMKQAEELDSSASWFVSLASSLLATTAENYIEYKEICYEMIDLLVSCKSKVAYSSGAIGLWNSLYMLSRVYPENSRYMNQKLNRPLKEWVPIREWSHSYKLEEMKMAWHTPRERGKAVISEILKKFLFPLLDEIQKGNVERERLKKLFTIINSIFTGGATCFLLPPSPLYLCRNTSLPWFNANLPNTAVYKSDIRHPSGKNVREMLVELIEKVVTAIEASQREHCEVLNIICSLLHYIIHINYLDTSELMSAVEEQNKIFTFLTDPVKKEYPACVYESSAYVCHMKNATATATALTEFHLRVIRLLIRLSFNVYAEVRLAAQSELFLIFAEYTVSKEAMTEDVIAVLNDKKASNERLRPIEMVSTLEVFEKVFNQIASMKKPIRKRYSCKVLIGYCEKLFEKLPRSGEWSKFNCKNSLELTRKMQAEKRDQEKKEHEELISMLLRNYARKDLLHIRVKLCRAMLWRCQMEKSGLETIKILLSKLTDDELYYRERSAEELAYYLQRNKVKTIRMNWSCPKKPFEMIPLKCGIRQDNLCLAYDSENLPNTEERWNNMVFFSKQFGCYKWPPFINVVIYAKRPQIDRQKLNDCEQAIVSTFEDGQTYTKWLRFLLIEKRDVPEVKESTVLMLKYLLRNFPDSEILYNNVTRTLMHLLKSRQRAEQRLAAEFFAGVAMGTKYRGFKKLNELWTWLAPAVDAMFDYLNADAYLNWHFCLSRVLHRDDTRRYWWFIEQFLKGMARPSPTAWHQAVRLTSLVANQWREIETRRRICEIAWRYLPKAKIETQRIGISTALKNICVILDANMNNDFKNLPKRFHLEDVDFWLQRFEGNLETPSTRSGTSSQQGSETNVAIANASKKISETELAEKLLQATTSASVTDLPSIYLRTLLEFLLQYYEECITCLTPGIVSLFPTLLEYANEDDAEYEVGGHLKDVDIKYSASLLIYESMSNLLLTPKFADSFVNVVVQSFYTTYLWRVKVSVLKFVQVLVFSNVYEMEKGVRPSKILRLIYDAIIESQLEVRTEASRTMLLMILCDYIKVDKDLTTYLHNLLKNKSTPTLHGAILGMGAVVRAHPFTTPPAIKPMLNALCGVTSHNPELQKAATTALREFRRTHRDNWEATAAVLGSDLVYKIENAIAPIYYA